jgi:hypothetical protein
MGDPLVAIDTSKVTPWKNGSVHKGTCGLLLARVHISLVMAVSAFQRVVALEPFPLPRSHMLAVFEEFFAGAYISSNLSPYFLACLNFSDDLICPFMGDVTIRAGCSDSRAVLVMDRTLIFRVDVVLHGVTANTEFFGISHFKNSVETTPEYNTGRKEKDGYDPKGYWCRSAHKEHEFFDSFYNFANYVLQTFSLGKLALLLLVKIRRSSS